MASQTPAPVLDYAGSARCALRSRSLRGLAGGCAPHTRPAPVLECRAFWGDTALDTVSSSGAPILIGDEHPVDVVAPSRGLPSRRFALAALDREPAPRWVVHLTAGMAGELVRPDGSATPLDTAELEPASSGVARYELDPGERLSVHHGAMRFELGVVRREARPATPLLDRLNPAWVNTLLIVMTLHALGMAALITAPPLGSELADDVVRSAYHVRNLAVTLVRSARPAPAREANAKTAAAGTGARDPRERANRRPTAGRKRTASEARDERASGGGTPAALVSSLFAGTSASLLGGSGTSAALERALTGIRGAAVAEGGGGLGGLATRGDGPGAGGGGLRSVGAGDLGIDPRGRRRDPLGPGGLGGLGPKTDNGCAGCTAGTPVIEGALDKELIRAVVDEHRAQIRYCYERELSRTPGLTGKIAVRWTIDASGRTNRAEIVESALGSDRGASAAVGSCLIERIRSWRFPPPRGGGEVIVRYPFLFTTSG